MSRRNQKKKKKKSLENTLNNVGVNIQKIRKDMFKATYSNSLHKHTAFFFQYMNKDNAPKYLLKICGSIITIRRS